MSQQDKQEWAAMLGADPKLRAAWDGFTEQLAKDVGLIGQGAQPTGQAIGKAADEVYAAALPGAAANDA